MAKFEFLCLMIENLLYILIKSKQNLTQKEEDENVRDDDGDNCKVRMEPFLFPKTIFLNVCLIPLYNYPLLKDIL